MPSTSLVIKKIKIKKAMRHKIIPVSITHFKRRERRREKQVLMKAEMELLHATGRNECTLVHPLWETRKLLRWLNRNTG